MSEAELPLQQLYVAAKETAVATILGALAYIKRQNLPPEGFIAFLGEHFAPTWEPLKGQGAKVIISTIALQLSALGGSIQSQTGTETLAEVLIASWPPAEFSALFHLTEDDTDVLWELFRPIMTYLNLHYEWHRDGDAVRLVLAQS
jgi:hypothetical protein